MRSNQLQVVLVLSVWVRESSCGRASEATRAGLFSLGTVYEISARSLLSVCLGRLAACRYVA